MRKVKELPGDNTRQPVLNSNAAKGLLKLYCKSPEKLESALKVGAEMETSERSRGKAPCKRH